MFRTETINGTEVIYKVENDKLHITNKVGVWMIIEELGIFGQSLKEQVAANAKILY